MNKRKILYGFTFLALVLVLSGLFFAAPLPIFALAQGERLMGSILEIGGGDIYMVTKDVDADDAQLVLQSGGGTKLTPQVDGLIFPKNIDFDLSEGQAMMMGMDTSQYDDEVFINASANGGTKIEETGGNDDPVETTAFSIGSDFGYGKTTLAADSGDTYAGYYWRTDFFDDVDADGVHDDAENGFISDFNEDSYILIGAKADWSNISTTALDNLAEISLIFTTSGTNFEIEAQISADADGDTGWANFDDGSADDKASFAYENCDNQFVAFYFDLSIMDNYDEDDYSTIKGLDYIDYRLQGYGDGATAELWVYYVAFVKDPSIWNFGSYDRPAITDSGTHDIPKTFIPSTTAGSESDGGMYLNYATLDVPVTTVTESSSVTSAYSNLINTDEQLVDGDVLPLNWRKVKFESDQSGTNKEDDYNLQLLPIDSGQYAYTAEIIRSHPDGGVEVKETFFFDFSGMDNIDTSASLLTWDTSTDKIYLEDEIEYDNMALDVKTSKDPADLVVDATEGLANTFDATKYLKSDWADEADEAFIQYTLNKQPSTTTGDILKFVRNIRYSADYVKDLEVVAQQGGPFWQTQIGNPLIVIAGAVVVILGIIGVAKLKGKKRRR
jgi:hypothetical protein